MDFKKYFIVFALFSLCSVGYVAAQCAGFFSPEPTCIRVLPNGDVEIDFDETTMGGPTPAQIDSIILLHSTTPFPTTQVATLPVVAAPFPTSITHVGANANVQDAYYIIVAFCAGGTSVPLPPSKMIRAIRMTASVTNEFFVNMSWNYDTASTTLNATVQRQLPAITGTFNNIGTPPYTPTTMTFGDTLIACDTNAVYKVVFNHPTANCQSQSSQVQVAIKDLTAPANPIIDSVSFDEATNRPIIGWQKSSSFDVAGYIVYFSQSPTECSSYLWLDTLENPNVTSFIDMTVYDGINPGKYVVQAYDNCKNSSVADCYTSMQLEPTLDVCEKSVRLDWNHYINFTTPDPVYYKIFVSIGGSNYVFVDSTFDNFYDHTDPVQNTILTYKVVAFNGAGLTASSNRVEVDAEFLKLPNYQYLRYATVDDDNYVKLELYTDVESDASSFILKRALDTSFVFNTVDVFHVPKPRIPGDSIVYMNDVSPLTAIHPYFYKVDVYDSCNSYMATSNVASTMRLRVVPDHAARVNKLEWNNVVGWQGGTFSYKIYRFLDGRQLRDPLTKFPDTGRTTTFSDSLLLINDNLTAGNPSQGNYCYYIEAIENEPSFKRLLPSKSYSNEVCVVQEPYISVPNAFTPNGDGKNETFNPVAVYHDISSFEFYVMNRHGQIIYRTNTVGTSWDGTHEGEPVPDDVYVYSVKYRSSTGQEFEKTGTVAVVR